MPEGQDNAARDRISCNFCSRSYMHQKHVNEHMREAHKTEFERLQQSQMKPPEEGPYKCEVCGQGFKNSAKLRMHRYRKHTKEDVARHKPVVTTFQCEKCGRGHKTKDALRMHLAKC